MPAQTAAAAPITMRARSAAVAMSTATSTIMRAIAVGIITTIELNSLPILTCLASPF